MKDSENVHSACRNSLLKSNDPVFVMRIVQLKPRKKAIANEFRDLLIGKFDGKPVEAFIGTFKSLSLIAQP
ncbi:Uncharacterized conserved protein [Klebsiella michiganensis]|nr:Uncharacterized conserved protein [Klebsiella michiganensis]